MKLSAFTQKNWFCPPDGNHNAGAKISTWPKWKFCFFCTNLVWPVMKPGFLIKRFWCYTRLGAFAIDLTYKSKNWDWWVNKNTGTPNV